MSDRPTHYQQLSPEAVAAVRLALEPIPNSTGGYGLPVPEAHESYDCENCPASFGYQPEHFLCPLCHGQLSGRIEIHFTPPYPPEPEPSACAVCGERSTIISSKDGVEIGHCSKHWPSGSPDGGTR